MNPEVKKLWIEHLTNGDYKQGLFNLHIEEDGEHKFCCLGVLCDLYDIHSGERLEVEKKDYLYFYNGTSSVLPPEVTVWAGLENENPVVNYRNDLYNNIAGVNDNGYNFEKISKIIEEQL